MKYQNNVYRSMMMITQFGINMLVPIFACSFLGIFLDRKLGTNYLMVIFFFIGALAGGRNVYVFAKKIYSTKSSRDIKRKVPEEDDSEKTIQGKERKV